MKGIISHDQLQLLDEIDTAILVVDPKTGILQYANRRACGDLEKQLSEILTRHYEHVFRPEFIAIYNQGHSKCADGGEHTAIYYRAEIAQWERIFMRSVTWDTKPAMLITITTISEIARSDYKFENLAYFDNLLKLPNGMKLEEDISELANLEAVNLIYFEILRFEEINDLYGWENGNDLLGQVRDWLLFGKERCAQVYRVNNGFAILRRGGTVEETKDCSRQIIRRFESPWTLSAAGNSLSLYCSIKIGIVIGKYIKNEMRNLLLRTIRTTKPVAQGYSVYDEATDRGARRALRVKEMLINCIHNDMLGFEVHYQPIVDVKTQQWAGLEALCRWTTPDGMRVSPGEFICVAEQLGLIDRVDNWVYKTAMRQCIELALHQKPFNLSINFSPTQSIDKAFIGKLLGMLKETGFPAEKLNLEITESSKMVFSDENLHGLQRLAGEGITLCLDDFGTGYSNFENLINLPVTILKTDKLFLDGIGDNAYRQYLLRMLAALAHRLEMKLVSEGVERAEQFKLLGLLEVKYAQGYYLSRPLSFGQLKAKRFNFDFSSHSRSRSNNFENADAERVHARCLKKTRRGSYGRNFCEEVFYDA